MPDTACPDCAIEMVQIEKTTFTGRDMREYQCPKCRRTQIIDNGKALWGILSEANEESGKE
jgi:ssDNA-binding Zn-finger/Zn-ribbon topoisomerase 1